MVRGLYTNREFFRSRREVIRHKLGALRSPWAQIVRFIEYEYDDAVQLVDGRLVDGRREDFIWTNPKSLFQSVRFAWR